MWIVFFHVAFVVIAVAFTVGVGAFFSLIVGSGNVAAIRTAAPPAIRLSTAGGILLIVGAIVGFGAAARLGYPLTATWLVVTYVLVAILLLDGFFHRVPWMRKVEAAARASADDKPSIELLALGSDRTIIAGAPISGLLWLTILIMMTVKP
jgi:hypothetical protein